MKEASRRLEKGPSSGQGAQPTAARWRVWAEFFYFHSPDAIVVYALKYHEVQQRGRWDGTRGA